MQYVSYFYNIIYCTNSGWYIFFAVCKYASKDDPGVQEAINCHDGPTDGHDRGLNELEQIFKQKTFTRQVGIIWIGFIRKVL